jgi:cytochrome c oxidase subunit II
MFETIFGAVPVAASKGGGEVDFLFLALLAFALALTGIMSCLIVRYLVIYRKGTETFRAGRRRHNLALDFGWTGAAIAVALGLFIWSSGLYVERERPPEDALHITAIGKRWMWKMQHPGGQREINSLHIPVDRPVVVELASQDVIHSFYVPAFRIKQDAVPGRATRLWFEATETGRYHLFCAEYCGAEHAAMRGEIVVMKPEEYAEWLGRRPEGETLAARGGQLFTALGCSGCHEPRGPVKAPGLDGLYRRPVALSDGSVVVADRQYIQDSILLPERDVVAGFPPIMPSYDGLLEPTEVMALVAYIESLSAEETR